MFEKQLAELIAQSRMVAQRGEGVAFLRVAKDLYQLSELRYLCVNIPLPSKSRCYTHCFYSDIEVKQFASTNVVDLNLSDISIEPVLTDLPASNVLVLPLPSRTGESGLIAITAAATNEDWTERKSSIARECKILSDYFHGHVLRINGCDSEKDILLSARELDCLKWTAAGKTAWEASVILGITERTVRFHLDAAREKLNCTTTTQAVAKAVASHLIDL